MNQLFYNGSQLQRSPHQLRWSLSLGLGIVVALLVCTEAVIGNGISETSMTELMQEALILISAILFGIGAWRYPTVRPLLVLFAGLFGCMFIRELDALFDMIFHGFWMYPALLLAAGTILYAASFSKMDMRRSLDSLMTPSFRLVSVGLLTVLLISRIVGTGRLWHFLLDSRSEGHLFKNAIQEGMELWGYALIATGAWCVVSQLRASEKGRRGEGHLVRPNLPQSVGRFDTTARTM